MYHYFFFLLYVSFMGLSGLLKFAALAPVFDLTAHDVIKKQNPIPEIDNLTKKNKAKFTVVIDPGHGGHDSGARGYYGTMEKEIVLQIAKRLAKKIAEQPNMAVVMTRSGDYFVPLRDRMQLARKGKGDIFIAIHADAYFNLVARGASAYTLSARGASTEAARWLASQDNDAELGDISFKRLRDKSPILRTVLLDLAQTVTQRDSMQLGNLILSALEKITPLHHSRVEQAPFMVLKSPDIPSALVEIGFISNPIEEKRLSKPLYQEKIAAALMQAILSYQH
jgi:N-acetylmuramoyl-L-alanine amidase